ncbi:hypothetical protein Taro_013294 [Colocasia esculenta]|uniref:Riboflavin synthase n=1 Tax=Colocasia esculenta TaxID=4460 RepID=A0A843UIA4_COLES|nr:hypothetical protein [Colocasia esculenta]
MEYMPSRTRATAMAIYSPTFAGTLREAAAFCLRRNPRPASIASSPPAAILNRTRQLASSSHLLPRVPPISPLFVALRRRPQSWRRPWSPAAAAGGVVRSLFTGIVEEMGRVEQLGPSPEGGGFTMTISASVVLGGVALGDSISVNGTCLTVTHFDAAASNFTVGLSPETLRRTSLGEIREGSPVNLERALRPDSRMGGHFVQGHVDGTGEIAGVAEEGDSLRVRVRAPPELLRYVVPKGFIAVDGTSLTVVRVEDGEGWFDFVLVAYTQQKVVITQKKVGDKVNLEVDILGKYVERLLKGGSAEAPAAAMAP